MTIRTVATLLIAAVILPGCASDEKKPTVLPPAPSPSSSPTPTDSQVPVPPEATAATQQGAASFIRFFFGQVNQAYSERDPEIVRRLAADECGSCTAVAMDIERLQRDNHRVAGLRYKLSAAEAAPAGADGRIIVDFRFTDDPYVELDDASMIVKDLPSTGTQDGQAMVLRVRDEWRVSAIRLVQGE